MQISFGQVAGFVWSYFRRPLGWVLLVVVLLAAQAALEVAMPYFMSQLVEFVSTHAPEQWPGSIRLLWIIAGVGLAFHVLHHLTHFIYDWHIKFPAIRDVGIDAFAKVQRFGTDWHVNSFAGAMVTRIKRGIHASELFGDNFYVNFIPLGFLLIGMLTLVWLRWAELGWAFVFWIAAYTGSSIYLAQRFVAPVARRAAAADTRLGAGLADSLSCNATVKSFGQEKAEDQRLAAIIGAWMLAMWQRYRNGNLVSLAQNIVMSALKMSLFAAAIWLWATGRAGVGDVVFIFANYNLLQGHLRNIGQRVRELQQSVNDLEEVVEYKLLPLQVVDAPAACRLVVTHGVIEFDQVCFAYSGQTEPIYQNFHLQIPAGQRVALVGRSGSGKSSFVKLLTRLYDLDSGTIRIDGQDIAQVTQTSLRANLALVPQEPILFHRSLAENIAYGRPTATAAEIRRAARAAHAAEFIEKLPLGYETLVGERGVKLSGGERQRVALARAILTDAPILILDEATSSLDSESERLIQDALEKLLSQRTSIVIAHRLSTIKKVDRILVFEGGQIVEDGSHAALVRRPGGRYRELYELQAGGFIGE